MRSSLQDLVEDILDACEHITSFIGNMDSAEYSVNLVVRRAVEREFEIIGEALRRMSLNYPEVYAKIPHARRIIDFRNLITHGYDVIDSNRVYAIAKVNIPHLVEYS